MLTSPVNVFEAYIGTDGFMLTIDEMEEDFGGLDATELRSAIGMSSANLDTQITAIPTNVWDMIDDLVDNGVLATLSDFQEFMREGLGMTAADLDTQLDAINSVASGGSWTTAITESYATAGADATPGQLLYMMWSMLANHEIDEDGYWVCYGLDAASTQMTFTITTNAQGKPVKLARVS